MATATLEVLCPNGRREKVKVQPGTPLLEVIDEVCTKQSLDPAKHRLVHGKKQIDSTLQFRYSGLVNNAKLDLVEAQGVSVDAEVSLALQMPDGERLMGTFPIETTLFDVLTHFQASKGLTLTDSQEISGSQHHPCCIYTQTEVTGPMALKTTNLRNFGLTGGRAVVRFIWKELSIEQLEEINREIIARQEKTRRLEERRSQAAAAEATAQAARAMDETPSESSQNIQAQQQQQQPKQEEVRLRSVFDDGPPVSAFGNQGKERSMFDPEPTAPPPPPARVESMFLSNANAGPQLLGQYAHFKFPEETKGQDLYKNELTGADVTELTKPCEREAVLYNTEDAKANQEPEEELPDDFYEVTKEDLHVMHQDLLKQANFSVASSAARRYERYERAVVRVHFPSDGLVLQAVFRPTEPVYALYKFVKQQLEGSPHFILYTPPRRILSESDMSETFTSAGLLPAVNIYISARQGGGPVRISSEARSTLPTSFDAARNVVSKWVTAAVNQDVQMEDSPAQQSVKEVRSSPTEDSSIRPPKWFKPR